MITIRIDLENPQLEAPRARWGVAVETRTSAVAKGAISAGREGCLRAARTFSPPGRSARARDRAHQKTMCVRRPSIQALRAAGREPAANAAAAG